MTNKILVTAISLFIICSSTSTLYAAKPDKGMKKAEKVLVKQQRKVEKETRKSEKQSEAKNKDGDRLTGLDKQREKKGMQDQKELDKGSEQGRTQREEVRQKWWKFWE